MATIKVVVMELLRRPAVFGLLVTSALVAGSVLGASPAAAQATEQLWARCRSKGMFEYQIAGCTALIQSRRLNNQDLFLAYTNRGQAYFTKGDYDHAIADLTEAITLDQTNATAFYMRGASFLYKGSDFDRATADCDAAIRLNPKYREAYRCRGGAYLSRGEYDRAIADFTETITLDPKDYGGFNNRAFAYQGKGDYDRAIADFTEAMRLEPKYTSFLLSDRGVLYRAKGDYARAMDDFNKAISLEKSNTPFFNRGVTYLYTGSLSKAVADLTEAATLYHDAYSALWLDIANKRSNRPSVLAEAWNSINRTKWPAPIVELYLGQKTPEAVIAAADNPDKFTTRSQACDAKFFIGELLLLRDDKVGARPFLEAAAADCPLINLAAWPATAELKTIGGGH